LDTKRIEMKADCRKLHIDKIHSFHSSSNIIMVIKLERMRWAKQATGTGEVTTEYKILTGEPEVRISVGR
jgi:hypothetical protein